MLNKPLHTIQAYGAGFLAGAMTLVVGSALAFEHIGGFVPCKLCLEQRVPYYVGIPIALLVLVGAYVKWPAMLIRAGLLAVAALMAYGLYLSVYHSGVEWSWWMGPADCATTATSGIETDASNLLAAIDAVKPPACDEAAGRFLGLSFAGWNVIASLGLLVVALKVALQKQAA